MMSITTEEELRKLRACGIIVARTLRALAKRVRPGITTAELSELGGRMLAEQGARSSPPMVYRFPGEVCISVNDEVVHGVPGDRVIAAGDLVKLDLTAEKDGFHTDAAITVAVPPVSESARKLTRCVERAFAKGLEMARPGNCTREIGRAVEREARRSGFEVIRELGGHGIGRTIHEPPSVPNFADPSARAALTPGLVLTIEPIIAAGRGRVVTSADGWTLRTVDGSLAGHFEHTLVVTDGAPILLTAA
jgi:methionyl aminopeptidase